MYAGKLGQRLSRGKWRMRAGPEGVRVTAAVLQLAPRLDRNGIGRDVVDLARHLRSRGWRALVASPGGALERELAAVGGTHLPVPLDARGRLALWRNRGRLARAIHAHRVSIVHAHGAPAAACGLAAARATGIPFIATLHDRSVAVARRRRHCRRAPRDCRL
jgi:Glycosyltransferase Family 4